MIEKWWAIVCTHTRDQQSSSKSIHHECNSVIKSLRLSHVTKEYFIFVMTCILLFIVLVLDLRGKGDGFYLVLTS